MAREILFENITKVDRTVINHVIEKTFKKNRQGKIYHLLTLIIGILAAATAVYFGRLGLKNHDTTALICTVVLIVTVIYCIYAFIKNTTGNQIKEYQRSISDNFLKPRRIKVSKNILSQSSGKSHGEYNLRQFTGIETWEHYFLLRYENNYVIVDKNGFTTGTPEEFEKFMNTRIANN